MRFSFSMLSKVLLLLLVFNFWGCDKEEATPVSSVEIYSFDDIYLPDYSDITEDFVPGTLTSDIMFKSEASTLDDKGNSIQCGDEDDDDDDGDDNGHHDGDDDDHGDNDNHDNGCKNGVKYLGQILNQLDLTDDQRALICDFKHGYHDCLKYARKEVEKQKKNIVRNANKEKEAIEKKLKKKEISKCEAKNQIEQLNQRTKQQLKALEVSDEVKACVCEFFQNILSILEPEQHDEFLNYILNEHPEYECDFGVDDPPEDN